MIHETRHRFGPNGPMQLCMLSLGSHIYRMQEKRPRRGDGVGVGGWPNGSCKFLWGGNG